eukprot:Gb_09093 [translate_table: standard]
MADLMSSDGEYDGDTLAGIEQDDDDIVWPPTPPPTIKVITKASLLAAQREDLRKVMEMLGLREQHARTLLIHHRWDVERLLAVLVDKGKDWLFSEAGVTVLESSLCPQSLPSVVMCNICMEDISQEEVTMMDCGHSFCNDCWTEYFIVKINEGQSRRVKCMAHKCNAICDEDVIRKLVSSKDPEEAERFERFLLESYIEDNNKVKWCPSIPNCGNAIRVEGDAYCEIECTCGQQFCFNCLAEAHSPCSCLMWELWDKKCKDESETVNWLTVHTKLCPKCHKPVEKNGGCNLVSCICGQAFCWLCGGATGREHTWTSIEGHSCGRYKEDREKESEKAKRDLKRYIHYQSRWKAHIDSLKLEVKQRESVHATILALERKESGVRDYSWLTNGLQRLFRARRALSYSYPFAFHMFGDDLFKDEMTAEERVLRQNLFEDQQQQLERTVERLSKFIEGPFDEQSESHIMEVRMQVINLSVLTNTLCKKMYDCIENDLLGSLQLATHHIAPYNSKGVERASELTEFRESQPCSTSPKTSVDADVPPEACDSGSTGIGAEVMSDRSYKDQASDYKGDNLRHFGSDDKCVNRKRSREESSSREENIGGLLFDLNLPAEVTDGKGAISESVNED